MGTKTRLIYLEVAIWWSVGTKSGWSGGGPEMGGDWGSEGSPAGGGGGCGWSVCGIEERREERKVGRGWQIMNVVG